MEKKVILKVGKNEGNNTILFELEIKSTCEIKEEDLRKLELEMEVLGNKLIEKSNKN